MHSHHTVHFALLTPDTVSPFDPRYTFPLSSQKHVFLPAPYTLPPSHTRSLLTYYIRYNSTSYPRYTSPFLFQRHSPLLSQDTLPPFLPQVPPFYPSFTLSSYSRYTHSPSYPSHLPTTYYKYNPLFQSQTHFPLSCTRTLALLTPDTLI